MRRSLTTQGITGRRSRHRRPLRQPLGRVESLESRRVLAASVYGFDHLVFDARQAGLTVSFRQACNF
ncbi:MAG: hypothetical protein FJ286_14440 [Planctomycetes bacterium]|nr:hypothetical protein [Planctomycetota bacterium]